MHFNQGGVRHWKRRLFDSLSYPAPENERSIIYSAPYNKSDHTVLTALPICPVYGKHWHTVMFWPRCFLTQITQYKASDLLFNCVVHGSGVLQLDVVLCNYSVSSEVVMRVFVCHVFHLVRQRLCFFGESVLCIWRAEWLTIVWPLVV